MSGQPSAKPCDNDVSNDHVAAVRAFNRFYTRRLGVLDQHLLKSPFSLSEARVLYELAHREDLSAKEIGGELGLDPGYLSRIVQNFDDSGLLSRKPLAVDRRQYRLSLTAKGRQQCAIDDHIASICQRCIRGGFISEDRFLKIESGYGWVRDGINSQ